MGNVGGYIVDEPAEIMMDAAELRRKAEERQKLRKMDGGDPSLQHEVHRLVHELQVHQVELELQNDELRRVWSEVSAERARYSDLYDFAPVSYFTLTRYGDISQTNLAGARLLGTDRSRLKGQRFGLWVHLTDGPVFAAFLEKVFRGTEKEVSTPIRLEVAGEQLWVHIEATTLDNGLECHAGIVDITVSMRAEVEKEQFLAMCSHELRTPLTVLQANADLLLKVGGAIDGPKREQLLQSVSSQARKLSRIVSDLLDVSRLSTGHLELKLAPTRVDRLVEVTVDEFRLTCQTHIIEADVTSECTISADTGRLEQVIINLLSNAVRYSPAGSLISVEFSSDNTTMRLSVTDRGRGIAAVDIPHLFERYYRTTTVRNTTSGMGIGLYISKEIVALHNGTIRVESILGQGSVFTVEIPILRQRPALP